MNHVLHRHSFDGRATEIRRIMGMMIILVLASLGWRIVCPHITRLLARSSVGFPYRWDLVVAPLTLPLGTAREVLEGTEVPVLTTHSLPELGWFVIKTNVKFSQSDAGSGVPEYRYDYYDGLLVKRGCLFKGGLDTPPGDMDGDGCWEGVVFVPPIHQGGRYGWAAIRLGNEANDVLMVVTVDEAIWTQQGARVRPLWRDDDSDGRYELHFIATKMIRNPQRGWGYGPPTPVAVFEWDSTGAALYPLVVPGDGSVAWRSPPGDSPLSVSNNREISEVLQELIVSLGLE